MMLLEMLSHQHCGEAFRFEGGKGPMECLAKRIRGRNSCWSHTSGQRSGEAGASSSEATQHSHWRPRALDTFSQNTQKL